jgi:hypothetical protein
MKKIILLSAFCIPIFFGMGNCIAQNCTQASIMSTPGKWKQRPTSPMAPGRIKKLPAEMKTCATIHDIISKKYSPKGVECEYEYVLIDGLNTEVKNHGYQFHYELGFEEYYCDGGVLTIVPTSAAPTHVSIFANHPGVDFTRNVSGMFLTENERDHYGWIKNMPVFKDGVWFLGEETETGDYALAKKLGWLVTYDGKLPFEYVTRKEYLEKVKAKLALQLKENIAASKDVIQIRPKAEQEKEKNEMVEMFVKGSARANKYLAEYKTDEEKLEESIKRNKEDYAEKLAVVEKQLKEPEAELKKTAIVNQQTTSDEFTVFAKENDPYAVIVVKDNPAYFNPKLPVTVPQLFYIKWVYEFKRPAMQQAYTGVMKNFDFVALKNLLGK